MTCPHLRHALPVTAGCEARREAQGSVSHPTEHRRGEGRAGEAYEPSMTPRQCRPRRWEPDRGGETLLLGCGRRRAVAHNRPHGHRCLRGIEGTHSGRTSSVRNMETPSGSGTCRRAGQPTAREAQSPGGKRMAKKRRPVAERRQETETGRTSGALSHNWPDRGRCLGPKGSLTWPGGPVE
jgi:hypothetical protein